MINGFPSSGLVNTIVASYLVSALNLDQICGLDSEEFPPVISICFTPYDAISGLILGLTVSSIILAA